MCSTFLSLGIFCFPSINGIYKIDTTLIGVFSYMYLTYVSYFMTFQVLGKSVEVELQCAFIISGLNLDGWEIMDVCCVCVFLIDSIGMY